MAFELPITAFKHVQWGGAIGDGDLILLDKDWSAATFRMELRTAPGGTGSALVTLTNASAGSQGVSAAYDSGYVDPETGEAVGATVIRAQIDEATLEALSLASPASDPLVTYYDLHITPSALPKRVYCYGTFTIEPGVTI